MLTRVTRIDREPEPDLRAAYRKHGDETSRHPWGRVAIGILAIVVLALVAGSAWAWIEVDDSTFTRVIEVTTHGREIVWQGPRCEMPVPRPSPGHVNFEFWILVDGEWQPMPNPPPIGNDDDM